MTIDTVASDLAAKLLNCLCSALVGTLAGPVCQCCLHPGTFVPMDVCCDCPDGQGQAAVRVRSIYPSTRFPAAAATPENCPTATFAVVLEMTAYRCAATLDDAGNPPTCLAVTHDALVALDDAAAMRRAVNCCLRADTAVGAYVIGEWQPVAVQGGCHGGTMSVTVQAADCCPPAL